MSRKILGSAHGIGKKKSVKRVMKSLRMLSRIRAEMIAVLVLVVTCAVLSCSGVGARGGGQSGSAGAAGTAAAKTGKEKEETCRVSGTVFKMVDGTPLKNATVRLENEEDHEHTIAVRTAADGRFVLKNVPSARYKLKVSRNGFVEKEYGQQKPNDPGAVLALSPGENRHGLEIKLLPAAVIAGRIYDEDGEPSSQTVVMASREVYHEGHRTLAAKGYAQTDDLGQYRIFGLAPGRYYVSAMQRDWNEINGDREFNAMAGEKAERGYIKTYYPGTPDPGRAAVIVVKEGEEVGGTDIAMKQVVVHRIRGKLVNAVTHKGAVDAELVLIARGQKLEWDFEAGQQVKKADGTFEIANIVPGAYLLAAFWNDQGKSYTTQEKIDIGESDVEGLSLVIGAGVTIPGRIRWEGKPSMERENMQVMLRPAESQYPWGGSARTVSDQQFTLKDIGDGDYEVQISGYTKDCYVKDVEYGGTHSAENKISVSKGGGAELVVTISSRGARVQGAVVDKDGVPTAGVWVVAVPDEARRSNLKLFKSQTTDQYGKYDLRGLAPGTYRIFSWSGVEQGEWEDAEFLRPQEGKGELLELQDEDAKTVNLNVIEKKSVGTE